MPSWEEYKTVARDRGALAFELYVAVSKPNAEPDVLKAMLPEHLAYIGELEKNGRLAFAGPLSDESGTQMQGMGMLILRAQSFEAAQTLVANDPMHAQGFRTFTLRRWLINEGTLQLTVGLSGQTVSLS